MNYMIKRVRLLLPAVLLTTLLHAQAPGGVTNGLTSWFKASGRVMPSDNASNIYCWASELSPEVRLLAPSPLREPVLQATNTDSANFNFHPFIQFTAAKATSLYMPSDTPNLVGKAGTIFVVTNMVEDSRNEHTAFTYKARAAYRYQMKPGWRIQVGQEGKGWTQDLSKDKVPFAAPLQSAIILISRGNGPGFRGGKNADSIPLTNTSDRNFNPDVYTGLYLGCNGPYGHEPFNGGIAEVVTYNTTLDEAAVNKVESYLAIKYGVTICQRSRFARQASNYTASDGTVFWRTAQNRGYDNCITGIGRDDVSGLLQKQSRSVQSNSLITLYNGAVNGSFAISNAGNNNNIATTNSFLLIADNGLSDQLTVCAAGKKYKRMERVWKVQKTGAGITTVTLVLNKGALPADAKGILVATSNAFATGAITYYPFTAAGDKLYVQVKPNDGEYFSIVSNSSCQ